MKRVFSLGLLYVTACENDVVDKQQNSAPNISIISHVDGVQVSDGLVEGFRATVSDDDNELTDLSVAWYVDEEIVCDWEAPDSTGESSCEILFQSGQISVAVEARDSDGDSARSEISVVVLETEAPLVQLLTPGSERTYYSNEQIHFSALVSDAEDGPQDLTVSWVSSIDGELILDTSVSLNGEVSGYTYLSEGNHQIELRVEDTTGKESIESVIVQVGGPNNVPSCAFTAPIDGDAFVAGELVVFSGTATDEDIANSDLSVEVSSNLDGVVQNLIPNSDGTFSFATDALSNGTHTVTLVVTDEVDAECRTSMLVSIGSPPVVNIVEPLTDSIFAVGDPVTFRGAVSDTEDQANQIVVVWNSNLEGELQSGNPNAQGVSQFTRSDLMAGVHSVSFSATDTSGLGDDDLVSFRINTLPVIDSIILNPNPVYSDDSLMVGATGSDADGQSVTIGYVWFENGVQTSFIGNSINASEIQVGETWTVRATPNDGFQDGVFVEETITVSNTEPTIVTPTISPNSNPTASTLLACATTGSDLDDGPLTPTYTWTASGGATHTGATWQLDPSFISTSETVTCTASVTDANGGSASATSASVTIVSSCGLTNCDVNLDLGGGHSLDLVLLPSGTFTMGSPISEVGREADEEEHTVTLTNEFYVMTTEVTQGMFAQLMGYESYDGESTSTSNGSFGVGADYPAYYVSWHMAADFANKATQRHNSLNASNLQECYSCSGSGTSVTCSIAVNPYQCTGYRLLTEAEWEYSARAGSTTALWTPNGGANIPSGYEYFNGCLDGWTLSDGTDLDTLAWFCANGGVFNSTHPYGSKEVATLDPNGHGLYDMSGNLLEWTQDGFGSYPAGSVINTTGTSSVSSRVVRGGAWNMVPYTLRSANRNQRLPTIRTEFLGFRLARIP